MEDIINGTLADDAIEKFAQSYQNASKDGGEAEITARFQYAYALLRSKHTQDIKHGISILEALYYNGDQNSRRDYLYYIAVGQTRLKQYNLALDCVEHFLQFEPDNRQAIQLRAYIKEKLTKDGIVGMAITGGVALALGGLIGLGLSLAKK